MGEQGIRNLDCRDTMDSKRERVLYASDNLDIFVAANFAGHVGEFDGSITVSYASPDTVTFQKIPSL